MAKDPAFLLYTKDFQTGTQDMSCEEVGAYLRLLLYQHQHTQIPNEKERLMRITGIFTLEKFDAVWTTVSKKFSEKGNHLVNHRLNQCINERATGTPKKIASACLAGLISSSKISKEHAFFIKSKFKMEDFIFENGQLLQDEAVVKQKVRVFFNKEINQPQPPKKMVNQMVNNLVNGDGDVNENIIDNEIKEKKEKKNIFKIPSISEIRDYCSERKNTIDPETFFNFYESKGWMVGKSKMKDWKACVRTWEKSRDQKQLVPENEKPFIGRMTQSTAEKNFLKFANVKIRGQQ